MSRSCIVINKLKNDLFHDEKIVSGMCIPIIKNEIEYLVSSHTLFKNIIDKTIFLESSDGYDNIETIIVKSFPEVNIDILQITEKDAESNLSHKSRYHFDIIHDNTECMILYDYIKEEDYNFDIIKMELKCKLIKNNFINFINNCPTIPIYELNLIEIDDIDYVDLIGCPLIWDDTVIGMIQIHQDKLIAIPIFIIHKLLEMFINNNKYELSNVFLNMLDKKFVKINNKDVINNTVYSDEMNIMIPIDTYMMLYAKDNKINIEQELCDKIKNISLNLRPLSEFSIIPYENNKIIKLNNLIIVELTHDIFTYYNSQYNIGGYTNEIYNKKIINYKNNKKNNHYFIVVKVLWNMQCNEQCDEYRKYGFPLVNNDDKFIIPILSKINNIKIKSITDFYDIPQNENGVYDCIFTLNNRYNKQKITLDELNIEIN